MVKIWYSVFGEGMGHAIRSAVVIEELSKRHNILITACDKAYPYLKKKFGINVHKIEGNNLIYENNKVNIEKTIKYFIENYSQNIKKNIFHGYNYIKKFNPEVIISDFEPLSHYFGMVLNIPVISVDNINVLNKCKINVESKHLLSYLTAKTIIKAFHPRSDYYLITAISNFKTLSNNVYLFKPIIRKKIIKSKPQKKNYCLVYQTSPSNHKLIMLMKSINEKFIVYGMKKTGIDKNIKFQKFSENKFIEDLRSCKAVILNGGFTLLTEAIYLKKPILAVPIQNQYEQIFNGITLKKCGFGNWHEELNKKKIENFFSNIKTYEHNLKKIKKWDNSEIIEKIEKLCIKLSKKPKILRYINTIEKKLTIKNQEKTLTIIKPDGVKKKLIGEIIKRFEKLNIKLVGMKMQKINKLQANFFYLHLKNKVSKSIFNSIISYMTENKVVIMVWQGKGVIKKIREICGPTNPINAKKNQIRSFSNEDMTKKMRYGKAVKNIIHSSENKIDAKKEISFFFMPWEIND
jgi:uncharacterized protein (TIGR00661 family)